jgi:hypothetical protein
MRKEDPVVKNNQTTMILSLIVMVIAGLDAATARAGDICSVYQVKAITNKRILPDTKDVPGERSNLIAITAAPGEYEPASFVVKAHRDIENLTLRIPDLETRDGHTISSQSIDAKVIKCWYQDTGKGYAEQHPVGEYNPVERSGVKALMPELLLNDDSLVITDAEHNYLRIKGKYVCISKPEGIAKENGILYTRYDWGKDFDVADAKSLQPVTIPKGTNKQFWLTAHVPDDTAAGTYETEISLKAGAEILARLRLTLNVLPFKLAKPYYISSMYYWYPDRWGLDHFRKEMENMIAHGVTNPNIHSMPFERFADSLKIRKEVGMDTSPCFVGQRQNLWFYNAQEKDKLDELKATVRQYIEVAERHGYLDVYFYGMDEAKAEILSSQRPAWDAIHEAGGKVFVAGYKPETHPPGNYAIVGDIQDMQVCAFYPDRDEAAKWHSQGHKILSYANPQLGQEQPYTYRANYGLLIWQYNYDGVMNFNYHWVYGPETDAGFLHGIQQYSDFGPFIKMWKAHNMVYPTVDGVIDTVQWEGYREGVDDVRYLTTLLKAVKKAEYAGSDGAMGVLSEARAWLKELKAGDINVSRKDLDVVRSEMIDLILKLEKS